MTQRFWANFGQQAQRVPVALHKGAAIVKAALPAAQADQQVTAHRRAVCAACPEKITRTLPIINSTMDVCKACGCPIERKTARADSRCPLSKW
jgi:rRNA maturation endonuclease Nob1